MAFQTNDIDQRGDPNPVRNDIDVMPITKRSYIMDRYPQIIYRKHTFFSAVAMGLSALGVALIVSGTAVVLYGMHLASEQPGRFVSFAQDAIRWVPGLQESVPPALMDVLQDRRAPEYCRRLVIDAETKPAEGREGHIRTTLKIVNKGDETVSLLSLRIVVLDAKDQILAVSNQWAATPFTAEPQWRGPLMPGYQRYLAVTPGAEFSRTALRNLRTEVEITDIRIWPEEKETWVADSGLATPKR
ncbi:MAG: hypothetical protein JSW66_14665 [Phycisphaerales bacterium]|nr:MAG: hypothetical protein JSW66_14665 [Phycisphaerales bacterium]